MNGINWVDEERGRCLECGKWLVNEIDDKLTDNDFCDCVEE